MKFYFLSLLIFCFTLNISFSQTTKNRTVSGYIKEQGSGELLIGSAVFAPEYERGVSTNNYGFYSLTLPESDSLEIIISTFGYITEKRVIPFRQDVELNISMKPDIGIMEEVIIETERYEKASDNARISSMEIPVAQIKDVPALMGEKDVFKVLQLMPGVKKGSEGSSGMYVRGGGPDQNLIILDDAPVYNAYHLFGFFSIFNGDAIKSVEMIKGGFPARYGGRLSSVVEMNMKEGNKEKLHGEAGIGLISSRLTLEGPLKKGKSSFLISGRRTYIDLLVYPLLPKESKAGYNFHDFNAKVNYDFGRKNKLYLSGYFGRDKFFSRFKDGDNQYNAGLGWSNATGTARWNHLYNNKLFANTSFIFSNYVFNISVDDTYEDQEYRLKYSSGIRDFSLKHDIDYAPNLKHSFRFGAIATYHTFTPGALVVRDSYVDENLKITSKIRALESGIYAEDVYKPVNRLTINAGIRGSHFYTEGRNYINAEPRLSAGYKLTEDLSVKAGYSVMNQYIHLISNTGIGLPTDLWVPSTANIKPQRSEQIAAGIARDFTRQKTSLTIEGYYKKTNNVLGYKDGASFLIIDDPNSSEGIDWEQNVTPGQSWAYGAEILLHKKSGRFSGWVGYTLSWIQVQFDSINRGEKFYAKYDRRHDISLVGIFRKSEKVTFSASWVYGTGNAINLPISQFNAPVHRPNSNSNTYYSPVYVTEYGKRNSSRMPAYHRLDVSAQFHKTLKWGGRRTWEISIYNAYNRRNPFFYFIEQEFMASNNSSPTFKTKLKEVTLFPVIPSITYQLKF